MSASFRISLLYILLLIPQHGNSPIPLMQSWLKKDQDDGFVQREMTSSLTGGDESFGSAHQTYQNSLIRKKKADTSGDDKSIANFDDFDSESDLPSDRYHSKLTNFKAHNEESSPRFFNKYKGDKYVDIVPSKNVMPYNRMGNVPVEQNMNPFNEDMGRSAKWSMCKRIKDKYSTGQQMSFRQSLPQDNLANYGRIPFRGRYSAVNNERRGNDFNNQYKDETEAKNPQIYNENEYYDAETNPLVGEDGMTMDLDDYNQMMNDRNYVNKREGPMQGRAPFSRSFSEPMGSNKVLMDVLKFRDQDNGLTNEGIQLEAMKNEVAKGEMGKSQPENSASFKNLQSSGALWNMDSNSQAKALHDVVKNSQRALKEVQLYQRKMAPSMQLAEGVNKVGFKRESRYQPYVRWENRNFRFDDKRLKREDEDEQKNMKTGTDEGGGGEYEDEEGKGHKDEEEYYEDADLSDEESGNEIRPTEDLNQKYVKRETTEDSNLKNSKETQSDSNSQDYEFNLENAPVEHAEKSRKASLQSEGEKTKKNSARKGVKIWDQWGKWSPCSVTCGVGRSTRWRHCIGGGCAKGEKEAQIKRCTNPAC